VSDRRSDLVDRLRPGLLPLPHQPQLGVCALCRTGIDDHYTYCHPCLTHEHLGAVTPISMSVHNQLLHKALWRYKNGSNEDTRTMFTLRLAALVSTFIEHHGGCLGQWDLATAVPSANRCAPKTICDRVRALSERYRQALVWDSEKLRLSVDGVVEGQRVLIFDDTFTTGKTLESACAALVAAGAQVVGPLVVGRHLNPSWAPSARLLEWLTERTWTDSSCCICGGESKDPGSIW